MAADGSDYGALADRIAEWLRREKEAAGAERFVLGLSGGIDSATVCGLCVRAAGAAGLLAAIMPSHSTTRDAEDAALVARAFGVETVTVDLSPVTEAFLAALPPGMAVEGRPVVGDARAEERGRLAVANVRPRLRMATLYYLANLRGGIVVGTGNKSEAMIGYFTKYGDGGVDLLPIVDLYKHEVRGLARELGVPEPVITKAPSAGLWEGQTDEAEIGVSYDELDVLLGLIERGEAGGESEARRRVETMIRQSEHKRRPAAAFRRAG